MSVVIRDVLEEVGFGDDADLNFEDLNELLSSMAWLFLEEFFHFMLVFKQRDGFSRQAPTA